eukprot:CAMPEP_0197522340 /NCGR_PEP_ID=MMETSP1318-20131121/7500_1 /TAXON_ID=552666 /ORGANISM="Partenskyella glossopodia, Strain RCC365" /LENGTH=394 /DNA_ID=CAMNT_0043074693 /DNA_START=12 /DNA_END=1196 /DNA_ORIENTATION=-
MYEKVYRTVGDEEGCAYIKIQDLADKVTVKGVHGSIALRIVNLMMSCHDGSRKIILLRAADPQKEAQLEDVRKEALKTFGTFESGVNQGVQDAAAAGSFGPYGDTPVVASGSLGPYASSNHEESKKQSEQTTILSNNDPKLQKGTDNSVQTPPKKQINSLNKDSMKARPKGAISLPVSPRYSRMESYSKPRTIRTVSEQTPLRYHSPLLRLSRRSLTSITKVAETSSTGQTFIQKLKDKMTNFDWGGNRPAVFTSTLPRAIETAKAFVDSKGSSQQWSALNVMDTGILHGMKVKDIKSKMPDEYKKWKEDPFLYRFPGGESYMDLCHRLSDLVLELERTRRPVVVVSHLSTLQALYAYFRGFDIRLAPKVDIPRHCLIELSPNQYGWKEKRTYI